MADKKLEKLLVESFKNLLDQDELGRVDTDTTERSHHVQFQWEDILRDFSLKVKDSKFFDALNAAFYKVHSYKWLEDSTFEESLISDLESQGIPHEDIELAVKTVEDLRNEYTKDKKNENAVGWAENLDEIEATTKEPGNDPISDTSKETMSGDNEPFSGAEPDNVRPVKNEA